MLDADGLRVGPPLARIGKIVCIGLNYHDHARETGAEPPAEPVIFFKAADTVVGPDDTVFSAAWVGQDRLGGRTRGRHRAYRPLLPAVAPGGARRRAAGYAVAHDVSEREFQIERGGRGQGQELRDVQSAGAVAGDGGRGFFNCRVFR